MAGIHIKDAKPGIFRNVPLGQGDVPFNALFKKLSEIDFDGPLMLEIWEDPKQDPLRRLQSARGWIQEIIDNGSMPLPE